MTTKPYTVTVTRDGQVTARVHANTEQEAEQVYGDLLAVAKDNEFVSVETNTEDDHIAPGGQAVEDRARRTETQAADNMPLCWSDPNAPHGYVNDDGRCDLCDRRVGWGRLPLLGIDPGDLVEAR